MSHSCYCCKLIDPLLHLENAAQPARCLLCSTYPSVSAAGYLEYFPELTGQQFGDLCFWFDDAIVMGIVNRRTGSCQITPDPTTVVSIRLTARMHHHIPAVPPLSCLGGSSTDVLD